MMIKLSDGTVAHVRMGKRGQKPSPRDIEALEAAVKAINELPRCPGCKRPNTIVEGACEICGWESECNHEDDGEGTCLGCGAKLREDAP
jgi:hypothetical protein